MVMVTVMAVPELPVCCLIFPSSEKRMPGVAYDFPNQDLLGRDEAILQGALPQLGD